MKSGDKRYIWERDNWPHWAYDLQRLTPLLALVHRSQGYLLGRMNDLGLELRDQAALRVLTEDVPRQVRSKANHSTPNRSARQSPGGWALISVHWHPPIAR
jgi:hypothetical protein